MGETRVRGGRPSLRYSRERELIPQRRSPNDAALSSIPGNYVCRQSDGHVGAVPPAISILWAPTAKSLASYVAGHRVTYATASDYRPVWQEGVDFTL